MYNLDKTACSKLGPCVQPSLSFAPDGCAVQWPVINLPMQDQRRFIVKVTSTEWLQSFLFTTWKILSPNDYENVQRCMPCPQINSFLSKTVSSPLSWQQWQHTHVSENNIDHCFCFASLSLSPSLSCIQRVFFHKCQLVPKIPGVVSWLEVLCFHHQNWDSSKVQIVLATLSFVDRTVNRYICQR